MAPLEKLAPASSELMPPPAQKRDAAGALLPYERPSRKLRIKRVKLEDDHPTGRQGAAEAADDAVPVTPAAFLMSPATPLLAHATLANSLAQLPAPLALPASPNFPSATPLLAHAALAKSPAPLPAPLALPPSPAFPPVLRRGMTPRGGRLRRGFFQWSAELRREQLEEGGHASDSGHSDGGFDAPERDRKILQGLFGDDDDWSTSASSHSPGSPPLKDFDFEPKCYCCERCFEQFTSLADLKMHHQRFHKSLAELHPCSQCSHKFQSLRDVQRHLALWHNIGVNWSHCRLCPASFRDQEELERHKLEAHGLRQTWHYCRLCDRRCKRKTHLRDHMAHVHGIGVKFWHCSRCPRVFKKDGDLKKHMAEIHGVGVRWFPCDKCGKLFKRPGHLRTHQLMHLRRALLRGRPRSCSPSTPGSQPPTPRAPVKSEGGSAEGCSLPSESWPARSCSPRVESQPLTPIKPERGILSGSVFNSWSCSASYSAGLRRPKSEWEAQPPTPALLPATPAAQPLTPARSQPCTPLVRDGEEASI